MFIISDDLQAFLLNLSITLALLFYFTSIHRKGSFISKPVMIGIVCSLAIGLCMIFSVEPIPEYIIDMRLIPFVIGSLYGGRNVALFLLISLVTFRFFLGGVSGFYSVIAIYPLLTLYLIYIAPRFQKSTNFKEKAFIAVGPTSLGIVTLFGFLMSGGLQISGLASLNLVPLYLTQLVAIFFFIYLIERKRNERLLLDEINKLEKLRIVSDIAASISHEVRNPLTVTRGFLQMLREKNLTNEQKEMYIQLSLQELDRADATITDYLTFAKPSLDNIEKLDLNKEINYVKDVVNPYALLHNVEVQFKANEQLFINGEKQKLHQCLLNIMKNAVEAMPSGGQLKVYLKRQNNNAVVTVSDNGVGMNQEQIEKLGTPYYSTKDKGTGLGTMVVFSIVEIMGGTVKVDSEIGNGTCFTLEFPLSK